MRILKINLLLAFSMLILSCGEDAFITPSSFSADVDENPAAGVKIGTVDVDSNADQLTYSLSNENVPGAITIDSNGDILVGDASLFDFETNTTITADYSVSGDDVEGSSDITINVVDVDESVVPSFTVWSGQKIVFTKEDGVDPTQAANQDKITDNVIITRDNDGGQIYNVAVEAMSIKETSPAGTEWAEGTTANLSSLNFGFFRDLGQPKQNEGKDLVLHLIEDDIYIDIKFISWSGGNNSNLGGFSYERSTAN